MNTKVILITGASSGIGYETAQILASQGHRVYAGARRVERMENLKDMGVHICAMDITNDANNKKIIDTIIAQESRIDVLINNAGFGLYGPIEEVPLEDAKYQFEVNLFGLASITKHALLPMHTQQSGRIVNISSMGGRITTPLGGWYYATKHALEGWSDCLRMEVKEFGINVVVVQPGVIKTEFGSGVAQSLSKYVDSHYKHFIDTYVNIDEDPKSHTMGTPTRVICNLIAKAATTKRPKTRYVKGQLARPLMYAKKWLGDSVYDAMIKKSFRILKRIKISIF